LIGATPAKQEIYFAVNWPSYGKSETGVVEITELTRKHF
jgi:hypothetical protein